ncbi:MAG TPA: hypothetical protein VFA27_01765 [Vicinamibacterales bacterium]|nr:hypothetical protein [Vicinamibacterales bacterium]
MATIINTLEVVLEQPTASPAATAPAPPKPAPLPLTPRDLEDVIERQARAFMRVAAH